jgi:hypothetical protein
MGYKRQTHATRGCGEASLAAFSLLAQSRADQSHGKNAARPLHNGAGGAKRGLRDDAVLFR